MGMTPEEVPDLIAELVGLVTAELPAAIELRHRLHAEPRVSGDEDDTAELLCSTLLAGAPRSRVGRPERVAGTGQLLRIGRPDGPSIALRAELDALPLVEHTGLPFASRVPGVMHACGHDVHCAALVAVGRALARGPELPLGVLAVLQPREESSPTGAGDVLTAPEFGAHRVGAVIGVHVQPALPQGVVSARPGPVNASCDELLITVTGRGGHAAYPHRADDPVLALAQTVVALHHLVGRRVDPISSAVLTVGKLEAGTASNIIPPIARAHGTLRALDPADRGRLHALVTDVVRHTAAAYGCEGVCEIAESEPVLANDTRLAAAAAPALVELGLHPDVEFRSCGSDDFAHYAEALPSLMFFLGVGEGELDGQPGLHDARFAPRDEVVGEVAMAYLAGLSSALTVALS